MGNLYTSLYDDIINSNTTNTNDITTDITKTLNGHTNLALLSNYYSIEEYNQNTHISSTITKPTLNILHLNIRFLQKNIDNLTSLLECLRSRPHIIAFTETWLRLH